MRLEMLMQVKQAIGFKKQNKSIREIAGTLGVAKSTVWSILRKKECTGELSNIVVDDCMDPLKGKENNIHNIQTSEEHSTGSSRVIGKVYNQEKTS